MLKLASIMHLLFISLHGDIDLGVLRFHGQVHLNVLYSPARSNLFFSLELALFLKMLFVLEANSGSFQHGLICFLLVSEQPMDSFTF